MNLLLGEVVRLLAEAAAWLAVTSVIALLPWLVGGRRSRTAVVVGAGLVSAAIADRLGLSDPSGFAVSSHHVAPLWIAVGGTAAVLAGWISRRRG